MKETLKDLSVIISHCKRFIIQHHVKLLTVHTAILVFNAFMMPVFAVSDEMSLKSNNGENKIHISSDRLILNNEAKYAEFIGNTRTTQGDTVITSDILKVFYKSGIGKDTNAASGEQSIKKIIAKGNVRIHFDNRSAEADQAVYTTEDRVLVLTGEKAKISSGEEYFTGEKIILHRDDGRIIIENRVVGVINPKENGLN